MHLDPACSKCGEELGFQKERVHAEGEDVVFVRVEPHECPESRPGGSGVAFSPREDWEASSGMSTGAPGERHILVRRRRSASVGSHRRAAA